MTAASVIFATAINPSTQAALDRWFWDCIGGLVEFVAIIRTIRIPAVAWEYHGWSKLAAVGLAAWFTVNLGILTIPVGALAVIWHTRTVARRHNRIPQVPDLPFAESDPQPRRDHR